MDRGANVQTVAPASCLIYLVATPFSQLTQAK